MLAFDNGATSKIDDVLTEHGGLLHVLTLTVHLDFFYGGWTYLNFILWDPSLLLVCGGGHRDLGDLGLSLWPGTWTRACQ